MSPISTSYGCSTVKAMARATALGGDGELIPAAADLLAKTRVARWSRRVRCGRSRAIPPLSQHAVGRFSSVMGAARHCRGRLSEDSDEDEALVDRDVLGDCALCPSRRSVARSEGQVTAQAVDIAFHPSPASWSCESSGPYSRRSVRSRGAQSDVVRDVAERLLLSANTSSALSTVTSPAVMDAIYAVRRRARREILARNVGGHPPSNASASPVAAVKSPNKGLSRLMLKSPQTTARGPASSDCERSRLTGPCSGSNRFALDQSPSWLATGWVLITHSSGRVSWVTRAPFSLAWKRDARGTPGARGAGRNAGTPCRIPAAGRT